MSAKTELLEYIKNTITEEQAGKLLMLIKNDLVYIDNSPLTEDEQRAIEKADQEILNGEFISLNEVRKQIEG
jgi:hypothetical protein